jgi:hypothetical protein
MFQSADELLDAVYLNQIARMWFGGSEGCCEKNCVLVTDEAHCLKLVCGCPNVAIFFKVINVHRVDAKRQFKLLPDKSARCNGDYWLKDFES